MGQHISLLRFSGFKKYEKYGGTCITTLYYI